MASNEIIETTESNGDWKSKTLLAGAVVGALTGLGAAYLLVRQAEKEEGQVELSSGQGLRLGMLVLTLLRQIGQLGGGG